MNMLGHQDVSRNDEFVLCTRCLKFALEDAVSSVLAQRKPSITTECEKVQRSALLIANKSPRHWRGFYMGILPPTLPAKDAGRMGTHFRNVDAVLTPFASSFGPAQDKLRMGDPLLSPLRKYPRPIRL